MSGQVGLAVAFSSQLHGESRSLSDTVKASASFPKPS